MAPLLSDRIHVGGFIWTSVNSKTSITNSKEDAMENRMIGNLSHEECMVLDLLQADPSVTYPLEDLVGLLPELHWGALFTAVDGLSRRRAIVMHRRGFDYVLRAAGSPSACPVGV